MKFPLARLLPHGLAGLALLLAGCAQPGMGPRGKITHSNSFRVRTTAYTGRRNAIDRRLSHGAVTSAASDWSKFPLGTRFRVRETGKVYEIDDYGPALVGSRTIDLCMPGRRAMDAWGVRWVNIDILQWGSPRRSMEVLSPREKNRTVHRMLVSLRRQAEGVPDRFHRIEM